MEKCPICKNPGITLLKKAFIGPASFTTCQHCGKKVGVPYLKSILAFSVLLLSMFIAIFFINNPITKYAILAIGVIITFTIYLKWVPLISKEKPT
jgi:hypothetical protein